jgi:membrane associated rhomboid family serine protease
MEEKRKTFKREVAVLQLLLHWALVMGIVYIAITQNDRDLDALVDLAIGLAIWVYGFAAAAYGLDSWAKQIMPRRADQQNAAEPVFYE